MFLLCMLGIFVFGLLSAFADDFYVLTVLRMIVGIFIGGAVPLCSAICAEVCPTNVRGRLLVMGGAFFAIGEMVAVAIAW